MIPLLVAKMALSATSSIGEAAGDVSGAMNARIAQSMANNPSSFKGLSHFFKDTVNVC